MKRKQYFKIFLFLSFLFVITSCVDQKKYIYFQKNTGQSDTINVAKAYVPQIQVGDLIDVKIGSLNPAASSFFNPFSNQASSDNSTTATTGLPNASTVATAPPASVYLVDPEGVIDIPIIGSVKIAGLTTSAARDTIKRRLKTYLYEPTVNVRFLNYKISVMGEVMHPSVYLIPNERVSLPEAISMAGDLSPFANHENLLVIRDNNGTKEFGRVNINSRDLFTSPYYYLHSGDIVYVEQTKTKAQQNDPTLRLLPIILSSLAALFLLIYRFK